MTIIKVLQHLCCSALYRILPAICTQNRSLSLPLIHVSMDPWWDNARITMNQIEAMNHVLTCAGDTAGSRFLLRLFFRQDPAIQHDHRFYWLADLCAEFLDLFNHCRRKRFIAIGFKMRRWLLKQYRATRIPLSRKRHGIILIKISGMVFSSLLYLAIHEFTAGCKQKIKDTVDVIHEQSVLKMSSESQIHRWNSQLAVIIDV